MYSERKLLVESDRQVGRLLVEETEELDEFLADRSLGPQPIEALLA